MSESSLPVYEPGDVEAAGGKLDDGAADSDLASGVVGVLLAAGTSSRFGDANKLLADLEGEPLVRHAASTLRGAGLQETVVVLGYEADRVRRAIDDWDADDLRFVTNPDYETGLSTSVARAVSALGGEGTADVDAAVFLPADMPAVTPRSVRLLVAAYRAGLGTALAAAYEGTRGNPVLFDRRHFAALAAVEGDRGGRDELLSAQDAGLVETDDPGVLADVDTREDLSSRN